MPMQPLCVGQRLDRARVGRKLAGAVLDHVLRRTKSDAFSGEAKRAVPLVGSV